MANEKVFQSRIQLKHDVEENWSKATNFIPKIGEIIIYDIDENNLIARFKIGDGITNINSLPFVSHHEVISYLPQELTEEQQMQARENLELYRKKKEPILITQVGPDTPGHLWDITYNLSNETGSNAYTIEIWDANPEQLREKFNFEQQGRRYNSGSGGDIQLYWYGNLNLIIQNDTAAATLANKIGYTSEQQYTDVLFVLYKYVDEDEGIDRKWCLFIDSSLTPLYWIGFIVKIFSDKTQTVYYPVPEEYIPNTIARISDIPQNIVQYSEQTLSEEEQMQARANLGLYHSKETLLETGELAFNENKIADICFGGINNTSYNGKYCKLVLKKDNINIECYGTVEARIYSQAFLLLVNCSFTGKYNGQNFTASYECVEGSGGLTITEIYSSVESSFVSSTWNYELYSVEQNFIPEKYIPDAIARVADVETSLATKLTIPETASVGQLIKVSDVTVSGKVIATEGQDVAYEDEALDLLYEMKVIEPIAAEDGKILTLESGEILLL